MASTSLGTLTLDLAVRLSEFTDGLTQAERQARDSASSISGSVSELRDNITADISKISNSFAGMAIGGIAVAAGAIAAFAIETAKADVQLGIMAGTANTSLRSFQVLSYAAAGFGVEQEALSAILADTQEKLGEFSATGGGGAADFFEALQNNTKATDEQISKLGKTLQGKDGVEAIQYLKDELDALGATSQEQRFIMESLAGDLGNLMPLFADGGVILEEYGVQLEDAGVIKTQEAIDQSRILAAQTQAIQTQFEGLKTQLVAATIPALSTLITYFQEGTKEGRGFKNEVNGVGESVRITTGLIIGLAASVAVIAKSFQTVGAQMRAIGQTFTNFVEADGVIAKSKALIAGTITSAGIMAVGMRSVSDEYDRAIKAFEASSATQRSQLTGLASVQYDANTFLQSNTDGLVINTVRAEENAKAIDARTKALEKAQKTAGTVKLAPNAKALANAENYGFANYEAQYGLPQGLMTGIHMQESRGNTNATGPSTKWGTAKGGFQLIDATAKRFQVDNAYNMEQATEGAAKYLSYLYKHFNGDLAKTIAAYNTGEGNVDNNPMSLILSDRWARNKKTGIGQTKEYTKNVLAYMKSATTDTSKLVYDTVTKQAQDAQKLQEETLKKQVSLLEGYMVGEEKITYNHKKKIESIEAAFINDDKNRKMLTDLQNVEYQKDLANFKFAAGAKEREQAKLSQSIYDSIKASGVSAADTGLDSIARRNMSDDDYSVWRFDQDKYDSEKSVNDSYSSRQDEINATDERGEFKLPELERFKLLEAAKQEHTDAMWAMDQEYALKQQSLDQQTADARTVIQANAFSAMTSVAAMFFGENSKMQKAAFIMERTYAVQKALMTVKTTYSNTFDALSAIPLIGPYIAMPGAVAASAIQIAQAAGIGGMAAPSVAGIAHGGLDNVPEEATYLLQKDERVLSPKQNKDLVKFMANGQKASAGNITINNNSMAEVSARQNPDGTVTVDMVDKMIEKSFKRIGRANSVESKSIQRGTTARVNRR